MSMTLSMIIPPVVARKLSAFRRPFNAGVDRIGRYFACYAAITHLGELEDWALRDVGLARSEIDAAVHGTSTVDRC